MRALGSSPTWVRFCFVVDTQQIETNHATLRNLDVRRHTSTPGVYKLAELPTPSRQKKRVKLKTEVYTVVLERGGGTPVGSRVGSFDEAGHGLEWAKKATTP